MNTRTPFVIYDAAAGSGKTFTLVKEYLKIILKSNQEGYYKNILAITFTNKAVKEMKERIVSNLISFSEKTIITDPTDMVNHIVEETGLTLENIQLKSKKILNHLLHNYSSFSLETIDSFNHRLIRTFARDLKLSGNFEVSLDIDKLLTQAVDLLISKAGENKTITKTIIEYSLEKIDEDKSWDVSKDITKAAKLIFNENDAGHLEKLKKKSLLDFLEFKKQLVSKKSSLSKEITDKASAVLQKIQNKGLQPENFMRKTLPNHFEKLINEDYNVYGNKLLENLQEGGKLLYKAATAEDISSKIDSLTPFLLEQYVEIKKLVFQQQLYKELQKSSTPLSVINLVNQEIDVLKEEQNIVPISDFNKLINSEIKHQPTPFIYERLGERYRHFFIDEFQDTSLLQWQNLVPLINNTITQQFQDGEQGSLMLVGDAKQSIYRWRGGLPEQFIGLTTFENPFPIQKKVYNLPTNYRSHKEIVDFNNDLFTFISTHFESTLHQEIYKKGNEQKSTNHTGGYVKLEFLDFKNKEESHEIYTYNVYETILNLLENDFQEKDICILTRKKADGIVLGSFLQEKGITVVSSETLLLQHSPVVLFLIDCLTLSLYLNNEEIKINFLEFLYDHLSISKEKHTYFSSLENKEDFLSYLKFELDFNFEEMQLKPLYESFEYVIRKFKLFKNADGYLFGLMDMIFDFSLKPNSNKLEFLEEWEAQKEKASIPINEEINGVQLMTVHRAKGLEFPVVIFPYADLAIYKENEPINWYQLKDDNLNFEESLLYCGINKIKEFGEEGAAIYQQQKETLELDNINLLYVALTRAAVQLYVFANKPRAVTNNEIKTYNQFLAEFLKHNNSWDDKKMVYEFGESQKNSSKQKESEQKTNSPLYLSTAPEEHDLNLVTKDAFIWGTDSERAIDSGNLVHEFMENIINEKDLPIVLEEIKNHTTLILEEKNYLKNILNGIVYHKELNHFFNTTDQIEVERKIITTKGNVLIPDRLNINKSGSITIIDYKTGVFHPKHESQINSYGSALIEMGYTISEKIVIYSSMDGITLKKV